MHDVSAVRPPTPRRRQATIWDAWLRAAARGLSWLIAATGREWRIRRDLRRLAAMDDRMLKDIGLGRCEVEYRVRYGRD